MGFLADLFARVRDARPDWDAEKKARVAEGKSFCPACYGWYVDSGAASEGLDWYCVPHDDEIVVTCSTCRAAGRFGFAEGSGAPLACGTVLDPIIEPSVDYSLSISRSALGVLFVSPGKEGSAASG